jgi:CHAD domain-containing protein
LTAATTEPQAVVPSKKEPDLTDVIVRPVRKLRALAATMAADATDDELHELRLRGKRLRYAAELAEPTGGKPVRRLVRATRALQEVLGDHQDAVVAEDRVRALLKKTTDPEEAFVAGRLVEREQVRQAATRSTWRAAYLDVDEAAAKVLS